MCRLAILGLLVAAAPAGAVSDASVLADELVRHLVGRFPDEMLRRASRDYRIALDSTTGGKASGLAASPVTAGRSHPIATPAQRRVRGLARASALDGPEISVGAPRAPGVSSVGIRVLRSKEDMRTVVELCTEAFKDSVVTRNFGNTSEWDPETLEEVTALIERWYDGVARREFTDMTARLMDGKLKGIAEARKSFQEIRQAALRSELGEMQITSVESLTSDQLSDMRKRISERIESGMAEAAKSPTGEVIRRRRARQWMTLLAEGLLEDEPSLERSILGSGQLLVCVPDAALPPPFPSQRPYRAYLSNVAVSSRARRRGVATRIIRSAERVARMWGFNEMWLHVGVNDPGAQALYGGLGYKLFSEDPWFFIQRRYLLKKKLSNSSELE